MTEQTGDPTPANVDPLGGGGETLSGFQIKKQGWPPGQPVSMVASVDDGDGHLIYTVGWHFDIPAGGESQHYVSSNVPGNPLSMTPLMGVRFYPGWVDAINPPANRQPLEPPLFYTDYRPTVNGVQVEESRYIGYTNPPRWYEDVLVEYDDSTNQWTLSDYPA